MQIHFPRLPWDSQSDQNIRECESIEEYHQYELLFYKMRLEEFHFINSLTGCVRPCNYNEYKLLKRKRDRQVLRRRIFQLLSRREPGQLMWILRSCSILGLLRKLLWCARLGLTIFLGHLSLLMSAGSLDSFLVSLS